MAHSLLVVADWVGFVGAFTDLDAALVALGKVREFTSFIYMRWPVEKPVELGAPVWVLPYLNNNAIAFVSTDKTAVEEVQAEMLPLRLVPPDNVDFWGATVGTITPPALRRFNDILTCSDSAEKDQAAIDKFLNIIKQDAPKADNAKKINIRDFYVLQKPTS